MKKVELNVFGDGKWSLVTIVYKAYKRTIER